MGAIWRGLECPRHTMQRLLPTFWRNDPVHPEILHQLSVVIPGVNAVLDGHAQPGGSAFRPRRDRRRWDRDVLVIDRVDRAMHVGEGPLEVVDNLRFGAQSIGSILAAADVYWRFLTED